VALEKRRKKKKEEKIYIKKELQGRLLREVVAVRDKQGSLYHGEESGGEKKMRRFL